MGGLLPRHLIAVGESQSAGRLTTYINAVHPLADVYDAFVLHSRSTSGAHLTQAPLEAVTTPSPTYLRDDLLLGVREPGALLAALRDNQAR